MSSELVVRAPAGAVDFESPETRRLIRTMYMPGASDDEFALNMEIARLRGLNPFTRQIFFVKRYDSQRRCEVWAHQVSIDGLRITAQRTGLYAGQDEPEFEYEKDGETLRLARVRVYRKDWARPAVGVAFWSEFVQTTRDGKVTQMWATKAHVMLAKCAEALALRKAFPEETSGDYTDVEMMQAENDAPRGRARVSVATRPALGSGEETPADADEPEALQRLRAELASAETLEAVVRVYEENRADILGPDGQETGALETASRACKDHLDAKLGKGLRTTFQAAIDAAERDRAAAKRAAHAATQATPANDATLTDALALFLARVAEAKDAREVVAAWRDSKGQIALRPKGDKKRAWGAACERLCALGACATLAEAEAWLLAQFPKPPPGGPKGGAPTPEAPAATDATGDAREGGAAGDAARMAADAWCAALATKAPADHVARSYAAHRGEWPAHAARCRAAAVARLDALDVGPEAAERMLAAAVAAHDAKAKADQREAA
jgi:phage recombination protein Bet